ncbi:putative general substrate transporter, MFS family [Crocosphaera subtropica ATCC 51142]|uniref:General substrate transporter, MFS family n=1 Tax=Crocosphaera subtropica (strain ATCC 51142 / BH68) TaxID=43989 RepID=B1WVU6_CROS5|nr:MFS transporter [Crocosphaera subtropica]ACB50683.1 putative general substrate transporter, MFS family [Crocosphaera subtropica ATCC 51142]
MSILNTYANLNPEQRRSLGFLLGVGLLFWISITTLLPTLPTYIKSLGGTRSQIGLVMGSFAIGLLCSRTLLGYLADTKSRKLVLCIGIIVAGLAPLGYLLIQSVFPLIGVRAVHGISIAAFTTAYSALVVDISPIKQRGELIGYMSLVTPIGMSIGPALGGFLQEFWGYTALFIASASFGFLGLLLVNFIQDTSPINYQSTSETKGRIRNFKQMISSHSLVIPALILLMIGLLFGTLITFLPLFLQENNLGFSAGLFYTVAAVGSFSSRVFAGPASDRYGRGPLITVSLLCYFVSMILLTQATGSKQILLAGIFEGIGAGTLIPMIIALISDRSSSYERGRVYSVCLGGFDIGIALAGPVVGSLGSDLSYQTIFTINSSLALAAFFLFISQSNYNFKTSLSFALGREKDLYAFDD